MAAIGNPSETAPSAASADPRRPWSPSLKKKVFGWALVLWSGFPLSMIYVFGLGGDRGAGGNFVSLTYVAGLYGMLTAPWLRSSGLRDRPWQERLEVSVTIWLWIAYIAAVTWELPFVLFFDTIVANADQAWTFVWLPYAEGGDSRYHEFDPTIMTLESLASFNGVIGLTALWFWYRSDRTATLPLVVFLVTASSHLYSTVQYYAVDALTGFPSVGDSFVFDLLLKFIVINSAFIIMPLCTIVWVVTRLPKRLSA